MKKKILLSVVALMLICFSVFGFVGCDSREGAPTLSVDVSGVTGYSNANEVELLTFTRKTPDDIGDKNSDGLKDSTDIVIYKNEILSGIQITYTYKDTEGNTQTLTWDSYQKFVNDGGNLYGFDLSNSTGNTYVMEFSYLGHKAAINYTLSNS